jgi:hypothetical protein
VNPSGGTFCESCGKALPPPVPSTPRVVHTGAMPMTAAGQQFVSDDLTKQTKRAANMLLVVAILQLVCGALIVVILSNALPKGRKSGNVPVFIIVQLGVAALFFGLYFWARRSPLPACIVGLVVYCTLVVINMINAISNLAHTQANQPTRGIGGLGIGWLDIVIIALLAQGISAGLKHRRLVAQQGA